MRLFPSPFNDIDLLDSLMLPSAQALYQTHSRAYARIDTSLRAYWHALFDPCPKLLELAPPDGLNIFRPFMVWAAQRQLSMDWSLHLYLHQWLSSSSYAANISDELSQALMAACAARWAITDRSEAAGIVLAQREDRCWIVGWKCAHVNAGRQIDMLELDTSPDPPPNTFGYFLVPTFEITYFPGWLTLPHKEPVYDL